MTLPVEVDLVLLTRDQSPPRDDVWAGIQSQRGVRLRVHRNIGTRAPGDPNRYETIARARNSGRRLGSSPWVMLLDDDVVLGPDCVAGLLEGLRSRPEFAAIAADCDGQMNGGWEHWDYPRHVGMASVLFRRKYLEAITFRWEPGECECRCCCMDLRREGFGIGYLPGAEARHRPIPRREPTTDAILDATRRDPGCDANSPTPAGRVLAAFDRKHLRLFLRRFLRTLRASGNRETVTAVVYGLYPSERRILGAQTGVEVFEAPNDGNPARRRLRDFQRAIATWPSATPVAYWDAADVVFQGSIAPLWGLVRDHPDRLLAAREVVTLGGSTVALNWVQSIRDPESRRRALTLLLDRPVLNAGFAAGTVAAMRRYLRGADQLLHSKAMLGTTDWGDQTAMNLHCHSHPDTWAEIPSAWNYVLVGLGPDRFRVDASGWTERLDGEPLYVVHGAGKTLKPWDLVHLTTEPIAPNTVGNPRVGASASICMSSI